MKRYKNLSGNSGVLLYEAGADCIHIRFRGSDGVYVYNYHKPGKRHVEAMKKRAQEGKELSTYISRYVKGNYADVL